MQELEAAELAGDAITAGNIDVSQALATWFDAYVDITTREATRKSYHVLTGLMAARYGWQH